MTLTTHKLHLADRAVMLALRGVLAVSKKPASSPESRPGFDTMVAKVAAADAVAYQPAQLGGVPGWWCRPADAVPGAAILYLHGGAYLLGSAWAYRNFAGQMAARAGVAAFVVDYGLAPERPFPAAFDDALAAYRGLGDAGCKAIALAGDSAGGGLALALLAAVAGETRGGQATPCAGAVVLSPWTDLALSGETMTTRADADPLLTRDVLAEASSLYLGSADPRDPRASPLYGSLAGLPPVTIHIGDDEVLLDDSLRYAQRIEAAGGQADLHVWKGMVHVFPTNSLLKAAGEALDLVAAALRAAVASRPANG